VLTREKTKPYRYAENQDQADTQDQRQQPRRSDIHQPARTSGDDG
jgi:hypothetical protein